MTKFKTLIDLMREYVRVADMCKGTPLENKPWECVKYKSRNLISCTHPAFDKHPVHYEFAVAILEGRPVFAGMKFIINMMEPRFLSDMDTTNPEAHVYVKWAEV